MNNLGITLGAAADEFNTQRRLKMAESEEALRKQQFGLNEAAGKRAQESHDYQTQNIQEEQAKKRQAEAILRDALPAMSGGKAAMAAYQAKAYNSLGQGNVQHEVLPSGGVRATFFGPNGELQGAEDFDDEQLFGGMIKTVYGQLAQVEPAYADKYMAEIRRPFEEARKGRADQLAHNKKLEEIGYKAEVESRYRESDPKKGFITLKGEDGTERLVDVRGGAPREVDAGLGSVGPRPLSDKQTTGLRSAFGQLYKISDMTSMEPAIAEKLGKAMTYGSALLQANKGSANAADLDVNVAAVISNDIVEGRLNPQIATDKEGNQWRVVKWNGRTLYLDTRPSATMKKPEPATGTTPSAGAPASSVLATTTGAGTRLTQGKIGTKGGSSERPSLDSFMK